MPIKIIKNLLTPAKRGKMTLTFIRPNCDNNENKSCTTF